MIYQTGQILLVHSTSKLAKIIQKFQMRNDPEAGYWNHSGLIWVDPSGVYVVEMAEVKDYKVRANTVFTPISEYLNSDRELLILTPTKQMMLPGNTERLFQFKRIVYDYIGTPYDYKNLLVHQVWRLLTRGKWIGRKKAKAAKRMVCHEFTQKIWNEHSGIFTDWNEASVARIFNSKHFTHTKLK